MFVLFIIDRLDDLNVIYIWFVFYFGGYFVDECDVVYLYGVLLGVDVFIFYDIFLFFNVCLYCGWGR